MQVTRREMLGAGIAAAATMATQGARAAVAPKATKAGPGGDIGPVIKLSCCAYSLRSYLPRGNNKGRISLHDFLELAAAWGIDGVELTSYYFDSEDKPYLHSLKAKAFKLGLDISGTAVGNNFCFAPGKERDEQIAMVKRWIDNSVILGSPCMRIFAGGRSSNEEERARAFTWVTDCIKTCCDHAGERGVFLALENHGHLTETAADVLKILDTVRHEWLGLNLDTGNFPPDVYKQIEMCAPRTLTSHVKVSVQTGGEKKNRDPADYARIVRTLRNANYRGFISLEYEDAEDQMVGVPKQLKKIREAIVS